METLTEGELVIYTTAIIVIGVSITILNSPRYRYITSAEYRAFEFSLTYNLMSSCAVALDFRRKKYAC